MVKSSDYTQDLSKQEIKDLQEKYIPFLKRSVRSGCIPTEMKKRLLHKTNWKGESNQEIYQFFSDIRDHALTGLMDLQLLCDTLNEKELRRIFGTKPMATADYPITKVLLALLPTKTTHHHPKVNAKLKEKFKKLSEEQEWRKFILHEIVIESLDWYTNSGIIKTDVLRRLFIDTMDALTVLGSGDKGIVRSTRDEYYPIAY